jgi:hypothetical protein
MSRRNRSPEVCREIEVEDAIPCPARQPVAARTADYEVALRDAADHVIPVVAAQRVGALTAMDQFAIPGCVRDAEVGFSLGRRVGVERHADHALLRRRLQLRCRDGPADTRTGQGRSCKQVGAQGAGQICCGRGPSSDRSRYRQTTNPICINHQGRRAGRPRMGRNLPFRIQDAPGWDGRRVIRDHEG